MVMTALCLPTWQSLCYGILPYVFYALRGKEGSIVLCVSPLVSLMIDQRDKFNHIGLSAEYIGELHEPTILANVKAGKYQLLFVSPESLMHNSLWR